jgi:hypothetical protein
LASYKFRHYCSYQLQLFVKVSTRMNDEFELTLAHTNMYTTTTHWTLGTEKRYIQFTQHHLHHRGNYNITHRQARDKFQGIAKIGGWREITRSVCDLRVQCNADNTWLTSPYTNLYIWSFHQYEISRCRLSISSCTMRLRTNHDLVILLANQYILLVLIGSALVQ